MTFEEWNEVQGEWWKCDTPEVFEGWWVYLIEAGIPPATISDMFDEIKWAMRSEYGE